jgi:hypothetical protein
MATYSQNWIYTKKYPKGQPVFFENGRRITAEKGLKLYLEGKFGVAEHLESWFVENGYKTYAGNGGVDK